jgi:5-formyltetrahydrofolate cyclo-ligase
MDSDVDPDVDPEAVAVLRARAKQYLRKRMRQLRLSVPAAARTKRSAALSRQIQDLDEYKRAGSIALFWPIERMAEVDLRSLDHAARAAGKKIFYPGGTADNPELLAVDDPSALEDRGRGYLEPSAAARTARRGDVELLVVPALAMGPTGHRLGYGGGYYDRLQRAHCPPAVSVAVAHSFQLLPEVPHEDHDVPCAILITEDKTLRIT